MSLIKPVKEYDNIPKLYFYNGIVVSVYDGDSLRAHIDLGFNMWMMNEPIRLIGIDTPEIRGEERPQGLIARDYVRERLPEGSYIQIMTERDKSGKYGRYLGTIFYNNGINLNEELLREGLAEKYY